MFGHRILILAPHPDDETVACAATIGRAQRSGAQIFVAYLTHGCPAREVLWPWRRKDYQANIDRRHIEALQAANLLRITPVGWSDRPTRTLRHHMQDVYAEIVKAIETFDIDQLWIPAYEGGHADHDTLSGLCAKLGRPISVLEFSEYNYALGVKNSNKFPISIGTETVIELTEEEKARKAEALALYESEKDNLNYVACDREVFRSLAPYDYARPPHEGTLWYERFHWVPLRHPRIDFTKASEVCAAITSFSPASGLPGSAKR